MSPKKTDSERYKKPWLANGLSVVLTFQRKRKKVEINLSEFDTVPPFKTKMTEPIKATSLNAEDRLKLLQEAHYNVFRLPSSKVNIDFLSDSGTGAMSQEQWSALFLGDEAYAGASSFEKFEHSFQEITGMRFLLPAHQGRAAERTLFEGLTELGILKKDSIIVSNAFFDTTFGWASHFSQCQNLYCDDFDAGLSTEKPFKGNLGLNRLQQFVEKNPKKVKLVLLTITNNTGGGQPVSMRNIREISAFCRQQGILFFFDACRFAENAFFIKTREKEFEQKTIKEIVREMFSLADGATFSAKKDARTNIGGAILFSEKNEKLFLACRPSIIRNEGLFTYGGLAGRDLEAVAQGIRETTEVDYLTQRIGQVQLLHQLLDRSGLPLLKPPGGHAVYIDAKSYLSHIPETEYRSDTLAALIYALGGIRSVAIGNLMYAQKNEKGQILSPAKNDFVRLAVPRNVYSMEHLLFVTNALQKVHQAKNLLHHGLKIVGTIRNDHFDHFDCKMEPIDQENFAQAVRNEKSVLAERTTPAQ
jgi:tryptophanase